MKTTNMNIPVTQESLFHTIRAGDRVEIRTFHGSLLKGRAVMKGPAGWVLNLGGRYGTPGIASEENVVRVFKRNISANNA